MLTLDLAPRPPRGRDAIRKARKTVRRPSPSRSHTLIPCRGTSPGRPEPAASKPPAAGRLHPAGDGGPKRPALHEHLTRGPERPALHQHYLAGLKGLPYINYAG